MKGPKDIEEQTSRARFMDMLEHPGDFSEKELKELLSDETNRIDLRHLILARKAYRRRTTPKPDVHEAWQTFCRTVNPGTLSRRLTFAGSIIAVAAILIIGFFIFSNDRVKAPVSLVKEETIARQQAGRQPHILIHSSKGQTRIVSDNQIISYSGSAQEGLEENRSQDAQTITIPEGKDMKIILSDGTEVWLNASSSLTFYVPFDAHKREVLLKGEAYFKVRHDDKRPFTVHSGPMNITVLGTEFNVRSYNGEPSRVTLVKGRVNLSSSTTKESVILDPEEEGTLNADGRLTVAPTDTYAITQWIQGYFYFENTPLIHVLKELARWYGYNILIKDKKYLNAPVHFSAHRDDTLHQTIENLNQLQKAVISVEGKNIVIR